MDVRRSDAESVTQFSTADAGDSCFGNREWSVCSARGDPDRRPLPARARDVFTGEITFRLRLRRISRGARRAAVFRS